MEYTERNRSWVLKGRVPVKEWMRGQAERAIHSRSRAARRRLGGKEEGAVVESREEVKAGSRMWWRVWRMA